MTDRNSNEEDRIDGDGFERARKAGYHMDPILDRPEHGGHIRYRDIDYEADPLLRLEQNERSEKQAFFYAVCVPIVTGLVAFLLALLSRTLGGPYCEAGEAQWICSRTFELIFPLGSTAVAFGGLIGGATMTYKKWASNERWRPWLAAVWFLVLFTIGWFTAFGAMAAIGHS